MPDLLPPLRLTGAAVLIDGALRPEALGLSSGEITAGGDLPEVDLSGYWLLPGIVDLHGDGFEHQIHPRPRADFPLRAALASTEREAAAHGVTTAYLAQGWSWEGGIRAPDQAEKLIEAVQAYRAEALIDLRVQIRAETHLVAEVPRLIAAVERFGVGYVVFNDHSEEGVQTRRRDRETFGIWARKAGLTGEELSARLDAARARAREVPRALHSLAEAFDRLGVRYGSHDDPDAETREFYRILGARIAEFPIRRPAAAAAKANGDPVLMGAPNVVRGGSQAANLSAEALIRDGLCDALVSDYHIPALPMAVWALVDRGILPFEKAWKLVSAAPARIIGLADRGRIEIGRRADLVVMNPATRGIEGVIAGGRLAHLSAGLAGRFLRLPARLRLAAE
ncbi:alpha-D-ribose 1-methylphosphonate 5-triphosphate diphosphatase [Xinfangfangia pollutisoli]|uniref:alpha-D-ribose 1-methylphosphonate 5-triphosphate diphosphatase n=1 Tax=Xinfangfangia pollutisoli TaxID=2865960 RepID=UPI001CD49C4B|nr:alpha-D-ribose 1-methylphosphonate 5-triphosphate diphosphatase [Xinfangfangia pollutisoli]